MNTKATAAGASLARALTIGMSVAVLDWTRDPNAPVECSGTVDAINTDKTIDVLVEPPAGIEPYTQVGLTECTAGAMKPGQWKHQPAPAADPAPVESGKPTP